MQFPAARCNISSALVIDHSGVSLRGVASAAVQSGFWGTKLKQTNANADIIDIMSSNPVTRGVTIEDVYLEGANGTGTGNGIVFVSSSNFQISQFDIERVQVNLVGGDGFLFKGAPTSTGNFQTVTWDAILDHATVFTAGENCFEWLGYTEQMVALHPYCGQAGKDAFHFDNQETSPGSQGIIALTLINPTSGAVSNYHYWMHGAQGVDVISPYNEQEGDWFRLF